MARAQPDQSVCGHGQPVYLQTWGKMDESLGKQHIATHDEDVLYHDADAEDVSITIGKAGRGMMSVHSVQGVDDGVWTGEGARDAESMQNKMERRISVGSVG